MLVLLHAPHLPKCGCCTVWCRCVWGGFVCGLGVNSGGVWGLREVGWGDVW